MTQLMAVTQFVQRNGFKVEQSSGSRGRTIIPVNAPGSAGSEFQIVLIEVPDSAATGTVITIGNTENSRR